MELVEGPTLADRIARGPFPVAEALPIARQIADALEAAHEQGIVHRDLKPANIKVRSDGTVKVLDFGLAKYQGAAASFQEATLPGALGTLTSPAVTLHGVVVGTAAYMAPEQARGQPVDARADLWAFGCVCYEMLTGRRVFDGDTVSDAISAVLTREPDWNALPDAVPASLRRLLRRCLARDLVRRQRHAGDLRLELDEISAGQADSVLPVRRERGITRFVPWAIAMFGIGSALWTGWRASSGIDPRASAPTARLELSLPPGFELFPSNANTLMASPDGRSLAFVGTSGGARQLFLRRLDGLDSTPVRGSLGATTGTFSLDGRFLFFVSASGEVKSASLADGLVTTVAKGASLLYGIAAAADDRIVFTRLGTLWMVKRDGGEPQQLTTRADNEQTHAWPSVLPDGRTIIFTVEGTAGSRLEVLTPTGERHVVLDQAARGKWGPQDRLFFYRDGSLLAVAFDVNTGRTSGPPMPVLETTADLGSGMPIGDVSPAGLMVFPSPSEHRLVWVSRQGVEEAVSETSRGYLNPRLSPDNTRIVFQAGAIWMHDLRRQTVERLSTLGAATNAFPTWLPDGTAVMYRSGAGLRVQSTASGEGRLIPGTTEFDYPGEVTSDGRNLVFQRSSPETSFDILVAPLNDTATATPLVRTNAYESGTRLSPDGRWLAYVSNESGRNEVYLRPFQGAERRQVSSDGGSQPVWNPNGKEIFYRIGDRLMAVDVTATGDELRLSAPRTLFTRAFAYGAGITLANYDVTRDGQRFLMVRNDTQAARLRVVLNWRPETAQPTR
jgi:Tol biopolymer transport system component